MGKVSIDYAEEVKVPSPLMPYQAVLGPEDTEIESVLSDEGTLLELIDFLSSKIFFGIGPKRSRAIVATFSVRTPAVIEQNPDQLTMVKGIGTHLLSSVVCGWETQSRLSAACAVLSKKHARN